MFKPRFLINKGLSSHKESFVRIFIVYFIIFIFIQALFIWIFSSVIHNVKQEHWNQEQLLLQKSTSMLDTDIDLMNGYSDDLTQTSSFYRLSQFQDSDSPYFLYTAMQAKNALSKNMFFSHNFALGNFFVYFWNTDYILSVNQFESADLFYNGIRLYPKGKQEIWKDAIQTDKVHAFTHISDLLDDKNDEYYYAVNLSQLSYKKVPATVVFSFELDQLRSNFSNLLGNGSHIIVLDENNQPLLDLKEDGTKEIDYPVEKLLDESVQTCRIDDETYHVIQMQSTSLDWTFILLQPQNLSSHEILMYQRLSYLILILSVFFGLFIITYLIKYNLKPIVALDNQLQTIQGDKEKLQLFIDKRNPTLCRTYIREIMRGLIVGHDEMETARDSLELNNAQFQYYVLYTIAYNNSNEAYNKNDFETAVVNELYKEFSCNNRLYFFSPEERTYALLLPFTIDKELFIRKIHDKLAKVNQSLLQNSAIWIFGGLSNRCCDLFSVWSGYQQARTASQFVKNGNVISVYKQGDKEPSKYFYPPEFAHQLTYFISKNNEDQIRQLFVILNKENFISRTLSTQMITFLINDIKNTLVQSRLLITHTDKLNEKDCNKLAVIDTKLQSQQNLAMLENIALNLCHYFERTEDNATLIHEMRTYLEENYQDPSLCLTKIADEFLVSESYVSHLFKNESGINFSTFLEKLRLDAAMRLIKEGNCKVSTLYMKVGYNNPTSLRRAFKKRYGVPPSSIQ